MQAKESSSSPRSGRRWLPWAVFPLIMGGALSFAGVSLAAGVPGPLIVLGAVVLSATAIAVGERWTPHAEYWSRSHDDVRTDALHMFFSVIMPPPVVDGLLAALLPLAFALVPQAKIAPIWPTELPLAVQLVLALLAAELFQYWIHRWMHERPLLWRLHAVHHSAPRLYWLNAGRFHPLDTALSYTVSSAPLWILGCPVETITLFAVFTGVHGMLQHANIELRLGWLNWVFSMSELHRWHHSRDVERANANYGANLILWDIVFGTRYLPDDVAHQPEDVGFEGDEDLPGGFLAQLLVPFRWR